MRTIEGMTGTFIRNTAAGLILYSLLGCATPPPGEPRPPNLNIFTDTRDLYAYHDRAESPDSDRWTPTYENGKHGNPLLQQALEAYHRDDVSTALLLARRAAEANPRDADAWQAVGAYRNLLGQLRESNNAYRKLRQLDPFRPHVNLWMAENHLGLGNSPEALRLISRELNRNPRDAWALSWMGTAYLQGNEKEKAAEYFSRAQRLEPKSYLWRFNNGVMLYNRGQFIRALMDFRAVMLMAPRNPQPYYWAGLCYRDLNQPAYARQMFEEYLRIDPQSPWSDRARKILRTLR